MRFLYLSTISFLLFTTSILAQEEDLLSLINEEKTSTHDKVITTFKESKVVNAQTVETVKAKTMAFNISHLFGNLGAKSNGGIHTLYGLDVVQDVRFAFDYGITNNWTVGIGRSKRSELVDVMTKYRLLTQTTDNHIPVSLALFADAGINVQRQNTFYSGLSATDNFEKRAVHRISYLTQAIIARKFGWRFSVELLPTFQYRNYVLNQVNANNGAEDTNGLFAMGGAFRFMLTKRVAFVADYFYTFSEFRRNNSANSFYNPLGVGVEIETGGHVFHINFSNTSAIVANNFIPQTTDNWLDGGFKLGFNISRVFNVGKKG